MSDPQKRHATNDDIFRRLSDVEQGLLTVVREQGEQGKRLGVLEDRWGWLTETLGRLLERQYEIAERTQVILQRHDQSDEQLRTLERQIAKLACARCEVERQTEGRLASREEM